jgi:DNA repair protein RadA/Sms
VPRIVDKENPAGLIAADAPSGTSADPERHVPAKQKTRFACSKCGAVSPRWTGQCAACEEWDCVSEVAAESAPRGAPARLGYAGAARAAPVALGEVKSGVLRRIPSGMSEFDRVLGGGLVVGGAAVLGGAPGAGKSTLLLQIGCAVARDRGVICFLGEESPEQIKDRAIRLALPTDRLRVVPETDVTRIASIIEAERPDLSIVDSINTAFHPELESEPGGAAQLKTCAAFLNRTAKQSGTSLVLVGHVTKAEAMAGPMALQHIVDTVMMLSSTDDARYHMLRADKNRFGSTAEVGVFAMTGAGLRVVENPSAIFLERGVATSPGSVVTPLWEGSRPMLVELQSLVDTSALGNPRRVVVGLDDKRVAMLLAVLHKQAGLVLADQDVFVNVVGGLRVVETSTDLAVLLAVASSLRNRAIPAGTVAFGEVGLSGEVRPCAHGQDRVREAAKLGFRRAVIPAANHPRDGFRDIDVCPVGTLAEALEWVDALAEP